MYQGFLAHTAVFESTIPESVQLHNLYPLYVPLVQFQAIVHMSATLMSIFHFPGVLDGFLQWYHEIFGFPPLYKEKRRK